MDHSHLPALRTNKGRPTLSRGTRLVLIGGLVGGGAFAGVTGIAAAASGPSAPTSGATNASPTSQHPSAPRLRGGRGAPGTPGRLPRGLRPGFGPLGGGLGGPGGGFGGPGGGGTITAISGSRLTLRTMNGTETVQVSSSTTYRREMQTIGFSDLAVGDVVHVAGAPVSSGSSSSPPEPGTGTVDATSVTVIEPHFVGRVISDAGGTLTLVGPDGQLLTVTTSGSTRYYRGASSTSSSIVSDGAHVVAEGSQTSLTHLDADVVALVPTPPAPGRVPAPPVPPSSSSSSSSSSSGGTAQ
jgi:hypothetical protein